MFSSEGSVHKSDLENNNFTQKEVIKFIFSLPGLWLVFKVIETGLLRSKEPEWFNCYSSEKLFFLVITGLVALLWLLVVKNISPPDWIYFRLIWIAKRPIKLFLLLSFLSTIIYANQDLRVGEDVATQVNSSLQWHLNQTTAPNISKGPDWLDLSKNNCSWLIRPPGASLLSSPGLAVGLSLGNSIRLALLFLLISGGVGWLRLASKIGIPSEILFPISLCLGISVGSQTQCFSSANVITAALLPWVIIWGLSLATLLKEESHQTQISKLLLNTTFFYLVLGFFSWIKLSSMITAISLGSFPIILVLISLLNKRTINKTGIFIILASLIFVPYLILENLNEQWTGITANKMYSSMNFNDQSLLWGENFTESTKDGALLSSFLAGPGYALPFKKIAHGVRDFFSQFVTIRDWHNQNKFNLHAFICSAVSMPLTFLLCLSIIKIRKHTSLEIWLLLGLFITIPFIGLAVISNLHGFNYVLYHAHTYEFGFIFTLLLSLVVWNVKFSIRNVYLHGLAIICLGFPIVTQAENLVFITLTKNSSLPSETEIKRSLGHSDYSDAIRIIEGDSRNNKDIILFLPEGNKGDLILRTRLRATAIHFAKDNLEKTGQAIASKKTTVYCCFPKKWRESQFMHTLRSVFHSSSDWNNLSVPPASKHSIIRISVEPDQLRQ